MPNTLSNIAMAIPLILGGHEAGHFKAGREANLPMQFKNGAAHSPTKIKDRPDDLAKMFAGGFEGQRLAIDLGKEFGLNEKAARAVSGLNSLGYALMPNGLNNKSGDVQNMLGVKGHEAKNVMRAALVASGISDMLKAFGKGLPDNQDLRFWTSDTGAPGLMYTRRF